MKFILSLFYLLVFSSLMAFGLDLTPIQAGISTVGLSVVYSSVKHLSGWSVPGLAMEFVTDLTGVTEKSGLRIFKPISGIGVSVNNLLGTSETIKIDLVNSKTGKTKSIVSFIALRRLLEMSSQSEGCWSQTADGSFGMFDVTPDGTAYQLEDGDYFAVELLGMQAGLTYDFYGIESPILGKKLLKYEAFNIPVGESERAFGVKGALFFGVNPTNGHLNRIKVKGEGWSTEMKERELQIMGYRGNDITHELMANVMLSDGVTTKKIFYPNTGVSDVFVIASRYQKSAFEVGSLTEVEVVTDGLANVQAWIVWEQ